VVDYSLMVDDPHDEALRKKLNMTSSDEVTTEAPDAVSSSERRRAGRIENVPPALLPLFRGDGLEDRWWPQSDGDDLDSARGIMAGTAIGAALWISIALFCYLIYAITSR
jgi:hypothetical protein